MGSRLGLGFGAGAGAGEALGGHRKQWQRAAQRLHQRATVGLVGCRRYVGAAAAQQAGDMGRRDRAEQLQPAWVAPRHLEREARELSGASQIERCLVGHLRSREGINSGVAPGCAHGGGRLGGWLSLCGGARVGWLVITPPLSSWSIASLKAASSSSTYLSYASRPMYSSAGWPPPPTVAAASTASHSRSDTVEQYSVGTPREATMVVRSASSRLGEGCGAAAVTWRRKSGAGS